MFFLFLALNVLSSMSQTL